MNVFISWSGERSRHAAEAFYRFLPMIMTKNPNEFYLSTGIYKGADWEKNLREGLQAADFGILCVTRDNFAAPWMIYEAGFLSHKAGAEKVAPFLLDVSPSELEGPLSHFQSTVFEKEDLQKLVLDMNRLESEPRREKTLLDNFEDVYSRWEERLQMASALEADEDSAESMARKTLADVGRLLRRSEKNQALLKKIASRLS